MVREILARARNSEIADVSGLNGVQPRYPD
jgi:hypothetical protein